MRGKRPTLSPGWGGPPPVLRLWAYHFLFHLASSLLGVTGAYSKGFTLWAMSNSTKADFCIHVLLLGGGGSYCYILNGLYLFLLFYCFFLLF